MNQGKLSYNHKEIESKWVKKWEENKLFYSTFKKHPDPKNKMFLLFAFAYPSGEGLHVGHVESKTALDILARYYRMKGKDVYFPVGWDAFGLPAENYAIKTGVPPAETTKKAIQTFKRQIKELGISYDWDSEIATCDPEYYKWTQWLFLKMYEDGFAYKINAKVNWCPSCQTVLANEQVVDGLCERCGTEVIQKELDQWHFKLTAYKDELISGLSDVDWPEFTKNRQINWIGKSEGAQIKFEINDSDLDFEVFTTAHDTIYGATFVVLAPEHTIIKNLLGDKGKSESLGFAYDSVASYVKETNTKTEEERLINKEKTGVFTGLYAINPVNGAKIPVWIADYVLMNYGTGAIMAVPGHDERDFEFANKHNLDVIYLVEGQEFLSYSGEIKNKLGEYIMRNSAEFSGKPFEEGRKGILDKLEKENKGFAKTEYRLRDWLVGRQRYWGAPIPIVYDPEGKAHPVKEEHLPWILPVDVDFNPHGESPLASSAELKERVERLYGKGWTPEYDTMDTFVDSSWYFLRFTDPNNFKEFASKEMMNAWMPVDFYLIGAEHTVLHCLYSRYFTKFLRDHGYLDFDEPFMKMRHQGMILGPDNKKMSKSKGNVINPDEIIEQFGADTLRMYEMFMGPLDADKPWDTNGVLGLRKFLNRVWKLIHNEEKSNAKESTPKLRALLAKTLEKADADIPGLKFNTAIAKCMEFINEWESGDNVLTKEDVLIFVKILAPFAPFLTEEIWTDLYKGSDSIHQQKWPVLEIDAAIESTFTIVVQVNGKMRGAVEGVKVGSTKDEVEAIVKETVSKYLESKSIIKVIYIPNKLINFVVN